MKNKLIILCALLSFGLHMNLQAKWHDAAYGYYCVIRWIISEKIKEYNPFYKPEVIEPEPELEKPTFKFKKYCRKYGLNGRRICRRK